MAPQSYEPPHKGVAAWGMGDTLDALDSLESTFQSPQMVLGYTTVQRVFGEITGGEPQRQFDDLSSPYYRIRYNNFCEPSSVSDGLMLSKPVALAREFM